MRYLCRSAFLMLIFVAITAAQAQVEPSKAPHFSLAPKALYEAASSVSAPEGAAVAVLERDFTVSFDSQGRMVQIGYLVYKVLTQKSYEGWDNLAVGWEPWHEARPEIRMRVITSDYAEHLMDQKTVTENPKYGGNYKIFSDAKQIVAPLPLISSGVVVEEEYTQRETEPLFSGGRLGWFDLGIELVPIAHSRVEIDAPKALPLRTSTFLLNNVKPERTESEGRVKLVYQINNLEGAGPRDSYMPPDEVLRPEVRFSTGASWQTVAAEYSKLVDSRVNTAAVKPIVDKLIAGKSSVEAKEAAILNYVQREVRFTGIELADGAIGPPDPAEILSKKYGGSKDIATLLVAMLRAAHIPSYIAFLDLSSRLEASGELPGMGLLNHAIVYVPGAPSAGKMQSASPALWIDPTDIYAHLGQIPPVEQGRVALIARPETTALVKTPESTSKDNIDSEFAKIDLSENGPASVTEKSYPKGSFEEGIRRFFAGRSEEDLRAFLTSNVKGQYASDKITAFKHSDPTDLSTPFESSFVCEKALRGYTNLDNAQAVIRFESLFGGLPAELSFQKYEEQKSAQNKGLLAKTRTADWLLDQPFQVDFNYRIVPPPGFVPKQLPKDSRISLGPAVLTKSFSSESNGTVVVHLNFDSVKRRYTIAEATELHKKVADILAGPGIMVEFESEAQVLLHEGKVREALASYRKLAALHPSEAIHHLQIARVLLDAGLGESARAEAQEAVRLEPTSAFAQKMSALILRRDLVGRDLKAGSDIAGAVEALRTAVRLDPNDPAIQTSLALALELDPVGRRYGPQARMKEAVAEYKKLGQDKLTNSGFKNNLAYALFFAGDYAGALKAAEALSPQPAPLIVACITALKGSKAGLAAANGWIRDEATFRQIVASAGGMLAGVRLYKEAADLLEAGASGDHAVQIRAQAALFRMVKRREEIQFSNSPRDLVLKFLVSAMDPNFNEEKMSAFLSRNAKVLSKGHDPRKKIYGFVNGKQMNSHLARQGISFEEIADVAPLQANPIVEGNDTTGYRVITRLPVASGSSVQFVASVFFVVKEDGEYKLLDSDDEPDSIALEMLDRIARKDLKGAKVLLDWLRKDGQLEGGDDPLAGSLFPRFWTEGQGIDERKMKLAAASILADSQPSAGKGISILEEGLKNASNEQEKTNIELALATAYSNLGDYAHLRDIASVLHAQMFVSPTAFTYEMTALIGLKRFDEAMVLADERLKRLQVDSEALKAKQRIELGRYNYAAAHEWTQKIADQGTDDPVALNAIAWLSLFTGHVDDRDMAEGLKASQLWSESSDFLNTVASLYAEVGKIKEAHEALVRSMDLADADDPREKDWYVLGRIAEQLGERETAIADYRKLERPTDPLAVPPSTYCLAQLRLKSLGAQSAAGTK